MLTRRQLCSLIALALALCAADWGARPATAADAPEQAELTLSNLPAKQTDAYKALRDLAQPTASQDLPMTKSEMWSVPAGRLDALLKATAADGVTVTRLDENWNCALTPMPASTTMTAPQEKMMHDTMSAKAVMGGHMVALPKADVMEYALTKGMNAPEAGAPAVIVIPLSETTAVRARRTGISKTDDHYVWHGEIEGTGEPVTLLWWPGGRLSGTVAHGNRMYVIKNMGGDMHGMVEYAPDKLPPDHGPAPKDMMKKMNMREDPLVHQGEAIMLKPDASRPPMVKESENQAVPKDATIDLIVAYTKKAASHYTNIEKDLIDVAIEEANQSFRDSGIDNVRLKLVHAYETDYVESGSHFDHVYRFRNKGDGYMDEIHGLRDKYKADAAVLVVDDPMGCGLSIRVGADAADAFSVVDHACAATMYSLAHEMGHLIGARHDRALDDTAEPFPYGHGFVHATDWRTMMSYKEGCNGCPRRPVWSSPDVKVNGVPAGDATTNNAKVIREQAARVAGFR